MRAAELISTSQSSGRSVEWGAGTRANYSSSKRPFDFLVLESSFYHPLQQPKFSPTVILTMATQVPGKRQQREEYRRKIQEQAERVDGDVSTVKMPKKRFFRQRAHANVFSDHNLD